MWRCSAKFLPEQRTQTRVQAAWISNFNDFLPKKAKITVKIG